MKSLFILFFLFEKNHYQLLSPRVIFVTTRELFPSALSLFIKNSLTQVLICVNSTWSYLENKTFCSVFIKNKPNNNKKMLL